MHGAYVNKTLLKMQQVRSLLIFYNMIINETQLHHVLTSGTAVLPQDIDKRPRLSVCQYPAVTLTVR